MEDSLGPIITLISLVIGLGVHLFFAFCLKKICEKAGSQPGFLIWIPILQIFPLLKAAGMAAWMFILFLIPIVNFIIGIMMWVNILKNMGKNPWMVILLFIPIVNIIYLLILAFGK